MLLSLFLAELAASIPRTEIVGKGDYFRFGMRDSLAIEASFLQVMIFHFSALGFVPFHMWINGSIICTKCNADRNWLYSQREEELLSNWWREYAECSEGPRGLRSRDSKSSQKRSPEIPESSQLFTTEEERVGVPVKGGLYEVVL